MAPLKIAACCLGSLPRVAPYVHDPREPCWSGVHSYGACCEWPPWTRQGRERRACFADVGRSYEECCNRFLGQSLEPPGEAVVSLPARWSDKFVLHYADRANVTVSQNSSYVAWRHGPWRTRNRKGHVLYQDFDTGEESCVLFPEAEHLARAFLVGGLGHFWSRQRGAPLRILDLGTGIGVVPVAAALAGHLALGLDFNPCMLEQAARNVAQNGVQGRAWVADFDMCLGPAAFEVRFAAGPLPPGFRDLRPGWFDVFVSSLTLGATLSATRCALELVAGLGGEGLVIMQVNWPGYYEERLAMVKREAERLGIEHRASLPMAVLGWISPDMHMRGHRLDIYTRRESRSHWSLSA